MFGAGHGRLGLLALALLTASASAQQIHRNGFEGRETAWQKGEWNVNAEEKAHALSGDYFHGGTSAEFLQLELPEGRNDPNVVSYFYPTPPAPVSDELSARVWVKASKPGIQLYGRLVLPRERNPKQLDEPLTVLVKGDTYNVTRRWQRLELANPSKLVKEEQARLRLQLGRNVDFGDAFFDRLVLNFYTGPGPIDAYLDDLEVGPVRNNPAPPPAAAVKPTPAAIPTVGGAQLSRQRAVPVRMEGDKLLVDNKPFFFRAIRHGTTPLYALRNAGFNTVWFDVNTPSETIEEAVKHGFWIVPSLPLVGEPDGSPRGTLTSRNNNEFAGSRDVEGLAVAISKFLPGDGVLFWDLGGALQTEKYAQVERTARAVSLSDPQRPRGADVWDGFRKYSLNVEVLGTHRFPLMTSLELQKYADWLTQRRRLTSSGTSLHWTWIQTHLPEWQARLLSDGKDQAGAPQPEQIRLLTYLAMATGVRGLGFWSDKDLDDADKGKDRWLELALLNQEMHMLEPLLMSLRDSPTWIETSHPSVKAAVLRTEKGLLVLPVWLGEGAQYVPPSGSVTNLSMIVPLVPSGAQPWELAPGRVQSLQYQTKEVLGGTRVVLPEFDLTSAVVFTSDLAPTGMVVRWQDHSRRVAGQAAQWMIDLATIELGKVQRTHEELEGLAPPVRNANDLLRQASEKLDAARLHLRSNDPSNAYMEAVRAMRPLRFLMRSHWDHAVVSLDLPSASPYAVSFATLPKHWKLQKELGDITPGRNVLPGGDFENKASEVVQTGGIAVGTLAGWQPQQQTLDAVTLEAKLVPASEAKFTKAQSVIPVAPVVSGRKDPFASRGGPPPETPDLPEPKLGESILRLQVKLQPTATKSVAPAALERTYLAANSPPVQLPPGTWVRISAWVRVPGPVQASADGFLLFDNIGGEGLGVRIAGATKGWQQYRLYRKVPASGVVWVTAAMTGIGTAYVDDVRIEPMGR